MKFIRDLFTESDNTTWDLGRVQGTIAFGSVLFAMLWAYIVRGQNFDPQSVGIGIAALMAGYGGMIYLKGKEQPATPAVK